MDKQGVNYARLSWTGETLPYSLEFNDYYYSQDDGLGESRYVYLAGNYLEERFTSSEDFLIAEFGFGTGLNFLATWDLWRKVARENSRLFYISFELSPLKPQDMRRVLSRWPELNCLSEELIELLPLPIRGLHRVSLDQGRVLLYLALGDVLEYLPYLNLGRGVDAWFLDGFSPDRNQRLWSTEVLEYLPKLSSPEATAATFSAAGEVGRTLERIGFKVHRKKGFGAKREMITAGLSSSYAKFYPSTRIVNRKIVNREKCRIVVVGGGLSGTAIASSLGRRGYRVQLLEQEQRLAQRASGNSAGIVMPHISARPDLMSRFYLSGYICLLQELKCLINKGLINSWKQCGVLRLATSSRLGSLISVLPRLEITEEVVCAYEPSEAQELVGFNVSCPGLYFPHGGSLSPVELCAANLKSVDGSVEVLYGSKIVKLERVQDAWRLFDASLQLVAEAEVVILAGGYEMLEFSQLSWLPLEKVRGQVFNIPATAESRLLKTVVCYDGYIIPECNQAHFIGATFDHGNDSTLIDAAQNQDLLSRLYTAMPDFPELDLKHAQARVSFRTMSRDRLPIIGPVPDRTLFAAEYKARKLQTLPTESNLQGLYVSVGHGSRGLTSCHLAAELIASLINDEPLPLEQDLAEALFPARYLAREIKVSRV